MQLSTFIGKPIHELLEQKAFENYTKYIYSDEPPSKLRKIIFRYKNNKYLEIIILNFQHIKRFNMNRDWEFEKVIQEKIGNIRCYQFVEGKKIEIKDFD